MPPTEQPQPKQRRGGRTEDEEGGQGGIWGRAGGFRGKKQGKKEKPKTKNIATGC